MPKDVILTPEGLQKLKDELELLSTDRRREVAERIKEAREFGDIAENSEYDDAKNEQAMLESRIAQLQEKLRDAARSEEHTSELQSPCNLVCRLLLEKKNTPSSASSPARMPWC